MSPCSGGEQLAPPQMFRFLQHEHRPATVDRSGRSYPFTAQQHIGFGGEHLLGEGGICDGDDAAVAEDGQCDHRAVVLHQSAHQRLTADAVRRGIEASEQRGHQRRRGQTRWTHDCHHGMPTPAHGGVRSKRRARRDQVSARPSQPDGCVAATWWNSVQTMRAARSGQRDGRDAAGVQSEHQDRFEADVAHPVLLAAEQSQHQRRYQHDRQHHPGHFRRPDR